MNAVNEKFTTKLETLSLDYAPIKAALNCINTKDPWSHLHGVNVKFLPNYQARICSTNGSMLFIAVSEINLDISQSDYDFWVGTEITIPEHSIPKLANKTKYIEIEELTGDQWRIGNNLFSPLTMPFPDVSKVIPSQNELDQRTPMPAQFNYDYLMLGRKALNECLGLKRTDNPFLEQFGDNVAIMHYPRVKNAQVLIMPQRKERAVDFEAFPRSCI